MAKIGGKLALFHQTEKSSLRIRVRKHEARGNFRAVLEEHAARAAIAHIHFCNRRGRKNFRPRFAASGSQRLRDRAHAADHVPVEALNFSVAAAQQMEQQSQRGAGVVRTAVFAVNIVRQKHRLHFFRFVMAIEKIAEASGEERDKLGGFIALHSAESFSHAQEFEPAARRR